MRDRVWREVLTLGVDGEAGIGITVEWADCFVILKVQMLPNNLSDVVRFPNLLKYFSPYPVSHGSDSTTPARDCARLEAPRTKVCSKAELGWQECWLVELQSRDALL